MSDYGLSVSPETVVVVAVVTGPETRHGPFPVPRFPFPWHGYTVVTVERVLRRPRLP